MNRREIANRVAENKRKIIEIAKAGEKRPNATKTVLGRAICRYANITASDYDHRFAKLLKSLRPDWFVDRVAVTRDKKGQLLAMAAAGEKRPDRKTPLGCALGCYLSVTGKARDMELESKLRALRPDWFAKNDVAENKEQLLKLAREGAPRPNTMKTTLGRALSNYTCTATSGSYDVEFDEQMRNLRPDWFRKRRTN